MDARTDPRHARLLLVLTVAAVGLRAIAAWMTVDIPGDGPSRAVIAYEWSRSPSLITYGGVWTPGFTYLAGLACLLIPDPRIAPRLLNILLGGATIPLLYTMSRRLYGSAVALTAAAILAVLPLHVGLSASSLTEAAAVFCVLGLVACAFAAAREGSFPRTLGVVVFGILAEMLRYETWLFAPLVVAYLAYRWRSPAATLALALTLLGFPALWSWRNYQVTGDAALGFHKAVTATEAPVAVSPSYAVPLFWTLGRSYLGAAAALLMFAAIGSAAIRVARRRATAEQTLVVGLAIVAWAVVFGLVLRRGGMVWGRYCIFGFVFALPLAVAWVRASMPSRRLQFAVAAVCLIFFFAAYFEHHPHHPTIYITRRRPLEIDEIIAWRNQSEYRGQPILLTDMDWTATYVPQSSLDLTGGRSFIVSLLSNDENLRRFVAAKHPVLLISRRDDASLREHVEAVLGGAIGPQQLVHAVGPMEVFDIRHLASESAAQDRPGAR